MATFYLDYEGGSDAADGTTFANRWKTITSGATAARIAPGDTIRIMGSPAPTSLGTSATWTNKSVTVTLASALNVLITDCETAWTASANVTCTADASYYRAGTKSAKMAIAAGFTTGKVAYFALGAVKDYSAYQGITFWLRVAGATLAANTLSIRLCSDTTGDVTVDTLVVPAWPVNSPTYEGYFIPVYIDKAAALGASIQSIALYADLDPGTIDVFLDNINTVKAAGNDSLSLQSLIGKNTTGEYWWALRSINGTTLTLDSSPYTGAGTTGRGYYGTTESVTTYKRETIKTTQVLATGTVVQAVQDAGTAGNLITFSGGWDRTAMTTQNLETWFDGLSSMGVGIDTNGKAYLSLDKIYGVRYYRAFYLGSSNVTTGIIGAGNCGAGIYCIGNDYWTANELHIWGAYNSGFENVNGSIWDIETLRIISCGAAAVQSGWTPSNAAGTGHWDINLLEICNSGWHGFNSSTSMPCLVHIVTANMHHNAQTGFGMLQGGYFNRWRIDTLNANSNTSGAGANLNGAIGELLIGTFSASSNGTYGLVVCTGVCNHIIDSLTTSGNGTAGVYVSTMWGNTVIKKSSMAELTKVGLTSSAFGNGRVSFHDYNGTAGDHRTYLIAGGSGTGLATIFSESSVRHTASGLAWKISPITTTYISALFPIRFVVAKFALAASVTKTISVWMRRTNTGLTGTLMVRGGQLDGISTDQTASITAIADTWEKVSVTVTPSVAGVIEVEVLAYGGTTYSLYIDDVEVS